MTKAPTAIGADAGSRAAAVASQSTAAPDTSARADRLRRVFSAVSELERQGADVRPVVLEVVADRVLDGPAPVPFNAIRGQIRARLGYRVGVRRLDRAIDRLVADGLLTVVREADPEWLPLPGLRARAAPAGRWCGVSNDLNALLAVLGVNGDDIVTVCYLPVGGEFKATVGTAAGAQARAEQRKDSADVWFGVNTFAKRPSAGRGKAADVSRLTSLYADLDVKDNGLADMDMVRAVLLDVERILGVPASATVESGNGLHDYWPISDGFDVKRAEVALHRFGFLVQRVAVKHGGAVDNVYELARVLRVPGTHNVKDPDNPKPVTLRLPDGGRTLTLDEVEKALDAAGVPADAMPTDARERRCHAVRRPWWGQRSFEQGGTQHADPMNASRSVSTWSHRP